MIVVITYRGGVGLIFRIVLLVCAVFFATAAARQTAHELELIACATFYDGNRQDVCFCGDSVLVASATGLEILDVAVSPDPCRVGQVIRTDGSHLVAYTPNGAALATDSDSLLVFRLTSGDEPVRVASFSAMGRICAMRSYREHLYFADQAGWKRISLAEPQNPTLDYVQATPAVVGAFGFSGDSLLVARHDGMTLIYDITGLPQLAGTFPSRPNISSLAMDEYLAYAAAGDSGVFVYDLRMEPDEMEVGRFYTYGHARDILLTDTLLCVADSSRGLLVFGLIDPYRPFLWGTNRDPINLRAIDVRGSVVAASAANGVFVIDIADPFRPYTIGRNGERYRAGDLAVTEGVLAAAVERAGLSLIDLSQPEQPEIISEMPLVDKIHGLDLAGDLVALAGGVDGLLLVGIAQPAAPQELFRHTTVGSALEVVHDDSLAIVADGSQGFRIFDITDQANARLIGGKSTRAAVTAVARRANYVYVVGPTLGLEVYDISFAMKPRRVHRYAAAGPISNIVFGGRRAFLCVDSTGILVFDISNLSSPVLLDRLEVVQHPQEVVVAGGLLFVLDDTAGVVMIDYRTPGIATIISTVHFASSPVSAAYTGDALFVSGDSYLHYMLVAPPAVPGDVNENGLVSLVDVVYLVNYVFRGGPMPLRMATADLKSDGRLNLIDLVHLIQLVFPR